MKKTKIIMGMPITIEVVDVLVTEEDLDEIFSYFDYVDQKFSTYKKTSEITKINKNIIKKENRSKDMSEIFELSAKTKKETFGYFDIKNDDGIYDPSGVVKGWAILNASNILKEKGFWNFYIDAGGDIQLSGKNKKGKDWKVGIRNPFNVSEVVKTLVPGGMAVATSGIYERGVHIYNPMLGKKISTDIVSITVIGENILDADRFATAAMAMGSRGIAFIENLPGFEGYMIDKNGIATYTSGFGRLSFDNENN